MSLSRSTIESETEFVLDGTHGSPVRVDEGIPVLSAQNVKGGRLSCDTTRFTNEEEYAAFSKRVSIRRGDLLLTIVGTIGRAAVLEETPPPLVFQRSVSIMRPKSNSLDSRFFYFVTQSNDFQRQLERSTNKSSQAGIYLKKLKAVTIPLPPLAEQKRIAGILDAADGLRAKRRESLAQLDILLQSTFLDMFGDPVTNPMGWEEKTLPELILPGKNSMKRGPFGGALKKEIFVDSGYLVYEQHHALNNDFSFGRYFITEEKYQELIAFKVQAQDILISCSGVYLGKLAIVPSGARPGIINQALLKISLDQERMPNVFFTHVFGNPQFKKAHYPSSRGVAIPNLPPMKVMKEIGFICPPLDLQQRFAAIVESVEQQKAIQRAHLEELDTLFASLQSRAFQGEL